MPIGVGIYFEFNFGLYFILMSLDYGYLCWWVCICYSNLGREFVDCEVEGD